MLLADRIIQAHGGVMEMTLGAVQFVRMKGDVRAAEKFVLDEGLALAAVQFVNIRFNRGDNDVQTHEITVTVPRGSRRRPSYLNGTDTGRFC